MYRDNAVERAQVSVLKSDAVELPKVEVRDHERKAKVVTLFKTIVEKAKPGDCLVTDMPDDVITGLRAVGVDTRLQTDR